MEKESLNPQAITALEQTVQLLSIGHYSGNTKRNYFCELVFLLKNVRCIRSKAYQFEVGNLGEGPYFDGGRR